MVAFQQTYTLTVVAWIVPYTIFKYKIMGGIFLVALTAWVASWAWYSITGLFICEFSILYRQLLPVDQTVSFHLPKMMDRTIRIPYKAGPIFLILLGTFLKYLWIAILPSKQDDEYVFHADINTAKLLRNNNPSVEAYPRYDNWFIAAGFFILLELSPLLRRCFSARPLVMLGRLSFSIILISGTVMMSLGSLVYQYLVEQANITNISTLTGIMFLIFIPLCLFFSFVWSIVVDQTSIKLSHLFFKFVKA